MTSSETVLFLAANPLRLPALQLDEECRASKTRSGLLSAGRRSRSSDRRRPCFGPTGARGGTQPLIGWLFIHADERVKRRQPGSL